MKNLAPGVAAGLFLMMSAVVAIVALEPTPTTLTETQKRELTAKIRNEVEAGQLLYGMPRVAVPPYVQFNGLDKPRRAAEAMCDYAKLQRGIPDWGIRVNEQMAAGHWRQYLKETVPHEVAHLLLCQISPDWDLHNPAWQSMVRSMGAEPVIEHSYEEAP